MRFIPASPEEAELSADAQRQRRPVVNRPGWLVWVIHMKKRCFSWSIDRDGVMLPATFCVAVLDADWGRS